MSSSSCILSYLETSALAIKDNFTIKSQNRVAMVQSSWEITRWYYGCNFRLDVVFLNTFWVTFWFLSCVRLRCHHSQNKVCWKLVTATLLFIKLGNWLPGYKSPRSSRSRLGFRPILLKKKKIERERFILSIKIPVIPPPASTNWVCYNNMADQGIEILIIQGSDLGLGTQDYFQFSVSSPSWGSPMPHFDRKLSQS